MDRDTTVSQSPPEQAAQNDAVREAAQEMLVARAEWLSATDENEEAASLRLHTAEDALRAALATPPAPVEGLEIARGIVEADLEQAKEAGDADWIGQSQEALDALDAALRATASPSPDDSN